nr:AAA family ATPase [uncultured Duganella sp.]
MQANYLNEDAQIFLQRMSVPQRQWTETVIAELQRRFPMADHWTTGGKDGPYIDIRIGKKVRGNKKGWPAFHLQQEKQNMLLRVNKQARGSAAAPTMKQGDTPELRQIAAWLDGYALNDAGRARLEGTGLAPSQYSAADSGAAEGGPDDEIDVDAAAPPEPAQALNRILYGPPGTGKTYRTISEALAIIEAVPEPEGDFDARKKRFDALRALGRIAFVTFHQSFSYEDFIEGIRAEVVNEQLGYKVRDGIFKKLAITAMYRQPDATQADAGVDFDELYDAFITQIAAALPYPLQSARGGQLEIQSISAAGSLQLTHPGKTMLHSASRKRMGKLYKAHPTLADLGDKTIAEAVTDVIGGANGTVYWAALRALLEFKDKVGDELAATPGETLSAAEESEYDLIKQRVLAGDTLAPNGQPYVLIIDEINRGNMSRVFGELITLIEPGKRAGRRETAEVQLPYSNERFSVPANLYIIGTMNTADRSLAVVDTALRRRFDFIEMMPEPDLLKVKTLGGVDLVRLLKTINQRIEHLYDREHTIGHSFFMDLTGDSTLADLALIFSNKVLPLLEEYFFEDWEKICKILGNSGIYQPQPTAGLGFAPAGKAYRRDLDRLRKAATYLAVYGQAERQPADAAATPNG